MHPLPSHIIFFCSQFQLLSKPCVNLYTFFSRLGLGYILIRAENFASGYEQIEVKKMISLLNFNLFYFR
jgi:hypothetical protein